MEVPSSRRRWADLATLIALAGLIVTMVFNTIGVRRSVEQAEREAEQARIARHNAQVGMLTSLSSFLQRTEVALAQTRAADKRCRPQIQLSTRDRATILTQLQNYDYLAWLFNQPTWTMEQAKRYWGPNMLRAFDIANSVYSYPYVKREFEELEEFHKTGIEYLPPPRPC
jgi:hypothetical protein